MNITFLGKPVTLVGKTVNTGVKAPSFEVVNSDLEDVTINHQDKVKRIISVIPSIDTDVCDAQTQKFNNEVSRLGDIEVITISNDLPFAHKRWCSANLPDATLVSDYKTGSFGQAFGVLIKELGLLARSVFVIDSGGTIIHSEVVSEVSDHLNYERAILKAKEAK